MAVNVDPLDPSPLTHWARHTSATETLRSVLSTLNTVGIEVLPVKGILTAHLLYDDVSARPIADIDLRVARKDFRGLLRLARANGWPVRRDSPHLWEAVITVGLWEVDVECTLSDPGLCTISTAEMIRRARSCVEPLGFAHLQPELHDHVLLLALNAFKDGLKPVPWALEDLRRIVRVNNFRADLLIDRAREGGVLGALYVVADWLDREHGAGEWRDIKSRAGDGVRRLRVTWPYAFLLRRGWPGRIAIFATASSNDAVLQALWGVALTLGGICKGRVRRTTCAWRSRNGSSTAPR